MSKPISSAQIRTVHVAARKAGLDDDAYREVLVARYGARTCKDLDRRQAHDLIRHLFGGPAPKGVSRQTPRDPAPADTDAPPPRLPKGVTRLATAKQRRFIDDLWPQIFPDERRYLVWLERRYGSARIATSADAWRVIEGLKAMLARKQA
ncbi:MAG: DUF1018 domain-containing protein [Rhodospirillales bacterium]|nr:DUF1018 domain-containing protein [Rhodospirillales bacterium]